MRIERITVQNFRCIREAVLPCTRLTALVGRNGAGKSSFLTALDRFFDPSARMTREDLFGRNTDEGTIGIRVDFVDLREEEEAAFRVYLEGQGLCVTKRFRFSAGATEAVGSYFANRRRFPPFAAVRGAERVADMKAEIERLVEQGILPAGTKPATKQAITDFMDAFEAENPARLEPQEDSVQFFGDKNVGGGKLDSFTRFVYVPAVRDVTQETGDRKTSLAVLLESAVMDKIAEHAEVAALPGRVAELVREVYNPERMGDDLRELASDLSSTLAAFVPRASIGLAWGEPRIPTFEAPPVVPSIIEDSFAGDPSHKGHGLQRALILTLLTHRKRLAPRGAVADGRQPDLIVAIEEPELYQHPARCRHVAEVLAQLSAQEGEARTQILYTTHSPYFVFLDRFEEVRTIRKPLGGGIPETTVRSADWETLRRRWAECCAIDLDKVTLATFAARALPAMGVVASEGYFADVAVLVEGAGDAALLNEVANQMLAGWPGKGVAVLPVGGKPQIGAAVLVLDELGVPTYFVFDGDNRHREQPKKGKGSRTQNTILLRIGREAVVDFPDNFVGSHCACFADEAESYCQQIVGDEEYADLIDSVAREIEWPDASALLKTPKGASLFVRSVYNRGRRLPLVEEMVSAIDHLANSAAQASGPG